MNISLKLAWRYLKNNKKRSITTIMGIIIVTLLLISIILLFNIYQSYMISVSRANSNWEVKFNNIEYNKAVSLIQNSDIKEVSLIQDIGIGEENYSEINVEMNIHLKAYSSNAINNLGIDKVDGILLDLGVSSYQLDERNRGFSYLGKSDLDMRMDQSQALTAKDIVNTYSEEQLKDIIFEYGEEKFSKNIARNICKYRENKKIETTDELVEIIEKSIPKSKQNSGHPAKRTFQAIRIEVNNEIKPLYDTVLKSIECLKEDGRLCIITFHSLEDRAVKNAYIEAQGKCTCPKDLPYCVCNYKSYGKIINKKPIEASNEEQEENSRSKSAKLRIFERHEKK